MPIRWPRRRCFCRSERCSLSDAMVQASNRTGRAASLARLALVALAVVALWVVPIQPAAAAGPAACANPAGALGVSRVVEIDTSTGPLFGAISTETKEPRFLGPKEVVLTFDDGPLPPVTKPILDTLDRFCTKATFYSVGRMAIAYPAMTREIMARGHTLGTHTWSHPLNLRRLSLDRAREEIEKGHAAVTMAAGQPIAPFFRFPGLSDSGPLLKHLQGRGIATFTVDVVSNDSYIADTDRLLQRTLAQVEIHNGGIVLFHDIKAATARMLPRFLAEIKARGYKVVHLRAKGTVDPVPDHNLVLTGLLAKSDPAKPDPAKSDPAATAPAAPARVPFYGLVKPGEVGGPMPPSAAIVGPPVDALAPPARSRVGGGSATPASAGTGRSATGERESTRPVRTSVPAAESAPRARSGPPAPLIWPFDPQ